jgi:pimeloyl-ACP methyl ester carboxylesterase
VLTELGVERAVAVGYSMGSPVAQVFWHRHPQRCAGVVLCAGVHSYRGMEPAPDRFGPLAPTIRAMQVARFLVGRVDADLRRWLLADLWRTDWRRAYKASFVLGGFDSSTWLGGVDVPHAVVITELDQMVPPARQRLVAEALPKATVHTCQSDHGDPLSQPNAFVPALLEALETVTGGSR